VVFLAVVTAGLNTPVPRFRTDLTMKFGKLCKSEAVMSPRSKADWRRVALQRRNNPAQAQQIDARAIVAGVESLLIEQLDSTSVVVLFDALRGEVDVSGLANSTQIKAKKITFALTRTPTTGHDLSVHPLESPLEQHRFGYRQPVAGSPTFPDVRISAVLVPALAFDRNGNRLGFGAGYYDRLLARLPHALKIGIADFVVDRELPTESFDIPMTHLATPAGLVKVV
jgi:5-formyltetrahydrofolate cyclo-ligase